MKQKNSTKVLHLVLIGKWYDMIASGAKKEEYREVKPYWFKRLIDYDPEMYKNGDPIPTYFEEDGVFGSIADGIHWDLEMSGALNFRTYTHVRFHKGYTNTTMFFKIDNITIGNGNIDWGAPTDKEVFIIKLRERLK